MYDPPVVPATGGGLVLSGPLFGHFGGWIYLFSVLIIALILFSMFRLVRGERSISAT